MSAVREARVPAVVKSIVVRLRPEQAFELFTAGLSRWWPLKTHSCAGVDALRVDIEPRVGGQVLEQARNGTQAPWGTVLAWDPPRHFAMTWHPAAGPAEATRLEVCRSPPRGLPPAALKWCTPDGKRGDHGPRNSERITTRAG